MAVLGKLFPGEVVCLGEGKLRLGESVRLGEGGLLSAKLIYVLSSFHMLFCAFYIHIHVKLIKFLLNLVF